MDDKEFLKRINDYSEVVLADIDPQKVPVSEQLNKLRPVMEDLGKELNLPLEDVFIKYMDLASNASVERENEFKDMLNN